MLNVKKLKKRTLYLTITAVLSVAVISTSAAVWASSNTPKVVPHEEYEESHANVQPGEQVPEAAPYDAVAEKESNNIDPQQNQARTAPVAESESNNEAKGKESLALPKIETDSKKAARKLHQSQLLLYLQLTTDQALSRLHQQPRRHLKTQLSLSKTALNFNQTKSQPQLKMAVMRSLIQPTFPRELPLQ